MATKPYFLWGDTHAASDSDVVGIIRSSALETAAAPAAETATSTDMAALASPELGAAAVARPRLRRDSSVSVAEKKKKQQQQQAGGGVAGAKKPPQRGLGVAELERLRCGGDPLLELSAVVGDAASAGARGHPLLGLSAVVGDAAAAGAQGHGGQGHPLFHYHHHHRGHLQMPAAASAFEPYCSQLLAPAPPPPPHGPVCVLHHPPAAATGCQRAPPVAPEQQYNHPPAAATGCQRAPPVAPEQQYFRDRWSRMGRFSTAIGGGGGADHLSQSQSQLLPATLAPPEHPSSQSTIWRPAVSSSSCLHPGHRCDTCSMRMRALAVFGNGGAPSPTPPDYSIYDLATDMATARQGDAFLAGRERKQGPAEAEAPAKKDVREIEFFPAASAHHTGGGGRVSVPGESEITAPFSSPYGYGATASHTAPQLDLSLRL